MELRDYKIKLINNIWYILLVLCTWFNSFSIQLEAHLDNQNINVLKRTEAGAGARAMKKRELRSRGHTHENQKHRS